MKMQLDWTEKMHFLAKSEGQEVGMDAKAPIGQGRGMTPKQLLLSGLVGCTAMDVAAWMRKHRQELRAFRITADVETSDPKVHPAVFTAVKLQFWLEGEIDSHIAIEGVRLSQTQYCGVSAMLSKAFPIRYEVYVNNELKAEGEAQFST
jgi:putative redox protein